MSKYIIKNCPAYYINTCSDSKVKEEYCSECTDCVMKQIIELCKERTVGFIEEGLIKDDMLKLLDIQEIE